MEEASSEMTAYQSSETRHQLSSSIFPRVVLERLPEDVTKLLFTKSSSEDDLITGSYIINGTRVQLSNEFVLANSSSRTWCKPVKSQDAEDVDSGIDGCIPMYNSGRIFHSPMDIDDFMSKKADDDDSKKRQRWKNADEKGEYEVQKVLEHKLSPDGHDLFWIKWLGWGMQFNSWEPLRNLHCENHLTEFMKKRILFHPTKPLPQCLKLWNLGCRAAIEHWSKNSSSGAIRKMISKVGVQQKPLSMTMLVEKLSEALRERNAKKKERLMEVVKDNCVLLHIQEKRREQLTELKQWECELNEASGGGLTVENNVDLEGRPKNFCYIQGYVPGPGGHAALSPGLVAGCECGEKCGPAPGKESCCPGMAGAEFAYHNGRLRLDKGDAIFECNRFCSCTIDCPNRVIQRGRKVKMCIFRTNNGRGWGVKAGENIKAGSFLTTYLGELIDTEEADKRDEDYVKTGVSYLFDLDYVDESEDAKYCVDALCAGNESHFINHSCDPNAHVLGAWIETCDPSLPLLALFARRQIMKGEEITFSYKGNKSERERKSGVKRKRANGSCKCGSSNCDGDLFFV